MNYYEYVDKYQKSFAKCGVTASILTDLENYEITETVTHYHGRKIASKETKTVSAYAYALICSSVGFFHDRITKSYTFAGYIPTRFSMRNPIDGNRTVREFTIRKRGE